MKHKAGFTLVELIVVLAVAGIIMAIAVNKFTRVSQAASESDDLQQISAFLQSQRLTAFTEKAEIDVRVNAAGDALTAIRDPSGTAVAIGNITLQNSVAPAPSTFTISTRGLFSTPGGIYLASLNPSAGYSCVDVNSTWIRLGLWDTANGKCDAK